MKISMIVPLRGEEEDLNKMCSYIHCYSTYKTVKEIIFINTKGHYPKLPCLNKDSKVKVLRFPGASSMACLEAGAFEATGEVLLFLMPGTFLKSHFDQLILASLQSNRIAGILTQFSTNSVWQKVVAKLPLCCVLCFMSINNFYTSRLSFHMKSRPLSSKYAYTFRQVFYQFAVCFNATII